MTIDGNVTLPSPKGRASIDYLTRLDTNDGALVMGILINDEYDLKHLPDLHGTAIDIGAHIGVIAIALAADHPDLRVIAVEAVPENVEVLRANIAHNKMGDRITVVEAAATRPGIKDVEMHWGYRSAEGADAAYVADSRYIANIFGEGSEYDTHVVPGIGLGALMGTERLALLKIDCEGCEWDFLRSTYTQDIDIIIGEYHNGGGLAAVEALVPSHVFARISGADDVGTFKAVRR